MKRKDKKLKRARLEDAPFGLRPWVLIVPLHLAEAAERLTGTKGHTVVFTDDGAYDDVEEKQ